jgi:hypothetical protein
MGKVEREQAKKKGNRERRKGTGEAEKGNSRRRKGLGEEERKQATKKGNR